MDNERDLKIGNKYRHFEGNEYLALHLANHLKNLDFATEYFSFSCAYCIVVGFLMVAV